MLPLDDLPQDPVALLRRESRSLVQRLRLWTPPRWAAATPTSGSRADLVHHLAQSLADLAADAEEAGVRDLPRLDSDLVLPDQLAVTTDDLVRTAPPAQVAAAATAHVLAHRKDLLDDDVPAGLAAALGLPDVVAAGRMACRETNRGIAR